MSDAPLSQPPVPARVHRRLRLALVAVSMLCALLVVGAGLLVWYWRTYLLEPRGDPFTRGPYLVRVSQTGAELRFRLRRPGPVELVATAPGAPAVTARDGRFRGLRPGMRYAWAASVRGVAGAAGSLRTAPRTLDRALSFVVTGDYGSGNEHEWAVGRVMAAQDPSFVLGAGDNSYLVAIPQLLDRNIFRPLRTLLAHAPLLTTFGEHDLFWRGGQAVQQALSLPGAHGRFVWRYGPIQVVSLGLEANAGSVPFARSALRQRGPLVRFVLVHRPVQPGNPVLPVLRQAGVVAVFSGHLHRYERRVVGGVRQFTVGTGGQGHTSLEATPRTRDAIVSLLDYGVLRVDLVRGVARYTFIDERGRVLDRDRSAT